MRRAVDFWSQALGYRLREDSPGGHWAVLTPANGVGAELALQLSTTPVQEQPRVHLDLATDDAAAQAAEVQRLVSLGAERVDWDLYPDDLDVVVLADPEANDPKRPSTAPGSSLRPSVAPCSAWCRARWCAATATPGSVAWSGRPPLAARRSGRPGRAAGAAGR
jgi:Glyoxalase-like domain